MREEEKERLTRFEMATIKRTAQNVKRMRTEQEKLTTNIAKLTQELEGVNEMIELFEAPVKKMTGGWSSKQVLDGDMDDPTKSPEGDLLTEEQIKLPFEH